ncbi:hypothetical protein [Dictyobacter formicarum]|uniref:Uncharacterized protein n=1 Tax=Dictyobacter formicarum TaxID=2778368 RepID=A0ABQ3VGB9_9CHLR|nr:hypothetical protein [Dictyobacter formicarum]GHO85227.1 hypothetical protein KSZ_32330 [Dictyobacter formicarum]
MGNPIDYSSVDFKVLLLDRSVKRLIHLALKHPDWTVSEVAAHYSFKYKMHGRRYQRQRNFSYKEVSVILQRLNLATPSQRRLHLPETDEHENIKQEPISDFTDYSTADLTTLLSNKYVQKLLATAELHPDWKVYELVSWISLNTRRYTATLTHAYEQASLILARLNMATPKQRQLRLSNIDEWETSNESRRQFLANAFPDFLLYLKARKNFHKFYQSDFQYNGSLLTVGQE